MSKTKRVAKRKNYVTITGGELRGRKVLTPGGNSHPMGERERIALFNMIADWIPNNYVMDLYCGSGILGIEALSRGANFALLIDNNPYAVEVANDNLERLDLYGTEGLYQAMRPEDFPRIVDGAGTGQAIVQDVPSVVQTATDQYGIVIADPPYDVYNEKMVEYLPKVVLDGGILVISHPGEPPKLKGVRLLKTRQYASAHLSIYTKD